MILGAELFHYILVKFFDVMVWIITKCGLVFALSVVSNFCNRVHCGGGLLLSFRLIIVILRIIIQSYECLSNPSYRT